PACGHPAARRRRTGRQSGARGARDRSVAGVALGRDRRSGVLKQSGCCRRSNSRGPCFGRRLEHAPPHRPLPPRPRQALPSHGRGAAGAGASHDRDDDVPRDGHDVLAGKGGSGDAGGRLMGRFALLTSVAAVALMIGTAMPAAAQALAGAELLAALRAGGYVIYFRHADTDHSRQDQRPVNLDDCATQRLLSDKGRANARAIGEAIRALDVPIGSVLASPLCRTVETAALAFGAAEKSMATREGGPDPVRSPERFAALRALLSTAPLAGKNTAIIGHGYPYYSLNGKGQMLEEGEAAIVRPHGTSFEEVARLGLKEWRELAGLSR